MNWAMKKRLLSILSAGSLLLPLLTIEPGQARGGHGGGHRGGAGRARAFPGRGFAARHAGFDNHYDNMGRWGRRNYDDYGAWGGWARARHRFWNYGWGGWNEPYYGGAGYGYVRRNNQSIDEEGNVYPARSYNFSGIAGSGYVWQDASAVVSSEIKNKPDIPQAPQGKPVATKSLFRVGPDVDILEGSNVAVHLNDDYFLLLGAKQSELVEQKSGIPVMSLASDPYLLFNIVNEMKRQSLGLNASQMSKLMALNTGNPDQKKAEESPAKEGANAGKDDSGLAVENLTWTIELLERAIAKLGHQSQKAPLPVDDPLANSFELFSSVWLMKDGSFVIYKQPDNSIVYMNARGTFSDLGKTTRQVAYPAKFEAAVYSYLKNLLSQAKPELAKIDQEKQDTVWALGELDIAGDGLHENAPDELESRTRLSQAVARSQRRLNVLKSQLHLMPDEIQAAKAAMAMLEKT